MDLHGIVPPPAQGSVAAPLLLWAPPDDVRTSGLSVLGEFAYQPTQLLEVPSVVMAPGLDESAERVEGFGGFVALNVGGLVEVVPRFGIAASLPVFLTTRAADLDGDEDRDGGGIALGDLQLSVPIGLITSGLEEGLGVGLVPFVSVPTGSAERSLGDPGPGAGVLATVGLGTDGYRADLNAGVGWRPEVDLGTQVFGGLEVPLAAAVGGRLAPWLWIGGEVRSVMDVGSGGIELDPDNQIIPSGFGEAGAPIEALAILRFDPAGRTRVHLGGGRGVTQGIGAANARAFLGMTATWGADEPLGVPYVLSVVDEEGRAISGAEIRVGSTLAATTDANGSATLEDLRSGRGLVVSAPLHVDTRIPAPEVDQESATVVLPWAPMPLKARIVDPDGQPVAADLVATSVSGAPPIVAVEGVLTLVPGAYRVAVSAPGFGTQIRDLNVRAGLVPSEIDAVLLPQVADGVLSIRLVDQRGERIEGARILVDGLPVGTVADLGTLEIAGVAMGDHTLEIQHPEHTTALFEGVSADGTATEFVLQRLSGSVRVMVRGPDDSVVPDAVARFLGPRRLAPSPLGPQGERVYVLGEGLWTLLVTSPTFGVQKRSVLVPEGSWDLIEVLMILRSDEVGEATLQVTVWDPEGRPVEDAGVILDGLSLGTTSTGGSLTLEGLSVGDRHVAVSREGMRPTALIPVSLAKGYQEMFVAMAWQPGQVEVVARTGEGPVTDGVLRFLGPSGAAPLDPLRLPPTGRHDMTLSAGRWMLLLTSETHGAQRREVEIAPDSQVLHHVDFLLQPEEGGDAVLSTKVVDPDGRPVEGATVSLDGLPMGVTGNTGTLRLDDLMLGDRRVEVSSSSSSASRDVRLASGDNALEVQLDWGPGTVRVRVAHEDAPVPGAMVRFLGPAVVSPIPVGLQGEVTQVLSPGTWTLLATSPEFGVGLRTVTLDEGKALTEVEVTLEPPSAGLSDLMVRVQDPAKVPIVGARVLLGGQPVGTTGPGGLLVMEDRATGPTTLSVSAPAFAPLTDLEVPLTEGVTDRVITLAWIPIPMEVRTTLPSGAPVAATVQLRGGPADVAAVETGTDGVALIAVPPGAWRVMASGGDLGAETTRTVTLGEDRVTVTLVLQAAQARLVGQTVELRQRVPFDFNEATLGPDSAPILDDVARVLRSVPGLVRVEVQGHTDNIGGVAVNQRLSQLRAETVVAALVARGVAPEALDAVGFGTQRPRSTNDTDAGRADNRRVQFEIRE